MRHLIPAVFLALLIPASARLGETVEQCRTRYGKETLGEAEANGSGRFQKNGISISVDFRDGKAVEIFFSHEAKGLTDIFTGLPDATIQGLLDANNGGSEWIEDQSDPIKNIGAKVLKRKDGTAVARWDYSRGSLVITAAEEVRRREAEKKKKAEEEKKSAEERAEGF